MAIFVSVEDKDGDQLDGVFEIRGVQGRFSRSTESLCLRFVSDSEDAAFNQAQLPFLCSELEALGKDGLSREEGDELTRVLSACQKIRGKKGASIHFYADSGSER